MRTHSFPTGKLVVIPVLQAKSLCCNVLYPDSVLTALFLVLASSWISLLSVMTLPLSPVKSIATCPSFMHVFPFLSSLSLTMFCNLRSNLFSLSMRGKYHDLAEQLKCLSPLNRYFQNQLYAH